MTEYDHKASPKPNKVFRYTAVLHPLIRLFKCASLLRWCIIELLLITTAGDTRYLADNGLEESKPVHYSCITI